MLKSTPFLLYKTRTISALLSQTEATGKPRIIQSGHSLGHFRLGYILYQVNDTRALVIPTYKRDVCFYDQCTATGENDIDIDSILQRAEAEHTRLVKEGRLPARPDPPRRKEIRFPVGEYHEITDEHQQHRYVFYEAVIPLAGTNTEPYKIVSWAKWQTEPEPDTDPLIQYGIGLPKDEIAITAYLCCRDEPRDYNKTLVVYRDGSADLLLGEEHGKLPFPKGSFTISRSQHYRFKFFKGEPITQ